MDTKPARISFLVLLIILMIAFGAIIRPFLLPALFALIIAVICDPIYNLLMRLLHRRRYIASLAATILVAICVVVPLAIAVSVIITNASHAIGYITSQLEGGQIATTLDNFNMWLAKRLPSDFNVRASLLGLLKSAGVVVYQHSPRVITATAGMLGGFILMIIFLFVFFADGGRLYHAIMGLLPLADEHKKILAKEIRLVIAATFLAMIATSVAQGILIGLGFLIAGIKTPLVWGIVAVGVTLVPAIGGPLMYVPASIALASSGRWGAAVFILIYGICIVSTIDNIVKPLVMRGKVNIHPLLLALSLIGGGLWLGPTGIIIGPLVVVLMLAMLKIYRREFV